MNLSLYQLLAAEQEPKPNNPQIESGAYIAVDIGDDVAAGLIASQAANQPIPATRAIYDPSCFSRKTLHQASFRQARSTENPTNTLGALTFSATVLGNALGFLAITSGLLLLLQIVQVSLG